MDCKGDITRVFYKTFEERTDPQLDWEIQENTGALLKMQTIDKITN